MKKNALIDFIGSHGAMPQEKLNHIATFFEKKNILKNANFLEYGHFSKEYLFLQEGFMRAYTYDVNDNEVTTYFFSKNRMVFEVSSFFMHTVSTETIQALTDCQVYTITFENLNMLFHTLPEFREFGRAMLVKEFAAFKNRTLALINKSAEERYKELLTSNQEIFKYAQLKYIASYLGITDTSLSRIRRDFQRKEA